MAISKTIAISLSDLYEVTANAAKRGKWFPKGAFEPSSQTKNKYFRGSWNRTARLEIGFYAKGEGKAQIAVQVDKLVRKTDVEVERSVWKKALEKLAVIIGAPPTRLPQRAQRIEVVRRQ